MRRIAPALSYANVMSTLCLFILLGGGAYAAKSNLIDGKNLEPRSVGAGKVKNDSLTGKQIKESKLGRVPDAERLAGKPASAYQPAGNYQPAGSYLAAGATAADAAKLGGKDPSAYVSADRILAASGTTSAIPAETLFTYAPLGLSVRTDGDADSDFTMTIVNDGPTTVEFSQPQTSTIHTVGSGGSFTTPVPTNTAVVTYVVRPSSAGDPKRALALTCGWDFSPNVVNCVGFGIG